MISAQSTKIITTEKDPYSGNRYIFEDGILISVHGAFCSGCSATRGVCGNLTKLLVGDNSNDF